MLIKIIIKRNKFEIILVVATASFYFLNNFVFKEISTGVVHYFLACYFNDLICPIGFLAYMNIMLSLINKKLDVYCTTEKAQNLLNKFEINAKIVKNDIISAFNTEVQNNKPIQT